MHWDSTAIVLQLEGVKHELSVAFIVEHTSDHFFPDFRLSETTNSMLQKVLSFGKETQFRQRRHFVPIAGSTETLDETHLVGLVKKNFEAAPQSRA